MKNRNGVKTDRKQSIYSLSLKIFACVCVCVNRQKSHIAFTKGSNKSVSLFTRILYQHWLS